MASDPYSGAPNPGPPQQSGGNKKVIVIIILAILGIVAIPCIGILAAIAIPAFLRYTKQSKSAEAAITLQRMSNKVQMHVAEQCEFPPELPPHADIEMCAGGAKCLPSGDLPPFWQDVGLKDPTYFVYSATIENGEMVLMAQADFNPDSPALHTEESRVWIADCTPEATPMITVNEFE